MAAIENSGQLDDAFETLFNWFFYFFVGYLGLAILGFDPVVLCASISSLLISFAFMIGTAASKYFEVRTVVHSALLTIGDHFI